MRTSSPASASSPVSSTALFAAFAWSSKWDRRYRPRRRPRPLRPNTSRHPCSPPRRRPNRPKIFPPLRNTPLPTCRQPRRHHLRPQHLHRCHHRRHRLRPNLLTLLLMHQPHPLRNQLPPRNRLIAIPNCRLPSQCLPRSLMRRRHTLHQRTIRRLPFSPVNCNLVSGCWNSSDRFAIRLAVRLPEPD